MADRDIYNVTKLFNLTVAGKPFKGNYSERCFINEALGYKDKIVIYYSCNAFDGLKEDLLQILTKNDIRHSCMVWKEDVLELYVECNKQSMPAFGIGCWEIKHVFIRNQEVCFAVEISKKAKNQERDYLPNPQPFQCAGFWYSVKEMFRTAILILIVWVNIFVFVLEFIQSALHLLPTIIVSCTPLLISIVNGITKCIGAFFLFLLALWRRPEPSPNNRVLDILAHPRVIRTAWNLLRR